MPNRGIRIAVFNKDSHCRAGITGQSQEIGIDPRLFRARGAERSKKITGKYGELIVGVPAATSC
jgi:hypothetical protein